MTEQELIANTAQEIKGLGPLPRLDLVRTARVNDLESRLDRLIDHVNKEIGVAQDVPLHERLECIEKLLNVTREKIKEKTKILD